MNKPYIRLLDTMKPDACKAYVVDGDYVRTSLDIEFSLGGHHYVYSYIPEDEIWVESVPKPIDMEENLVHEITERIYMKIGKLDYDHAHEIASSIEHTIRMLDPKKNQKEGAMNSVTAKLDAVASAIEPESKVIAHAIDKISDLLEMVQASVTIERLITKTTPDGSFSVKDLKNVSKEDVEQAQAILGGKPGTVEAGMNSKAVMLALALLAAGFNKADATTVREVIKMPAIEIKGKLPKVQMELQKMFPKLFLAEAK